MVISSVKGRRKKEEKKEGGLKYIFTFYLFLVRNLKCVCLYVNNAFILVVVTQASIKIFTLHDGNALSFKMIVLKT